MGQDTISAPTPHAQTPDRFRDQLASVTRDGQRIWMYPKKPRGRLAAWRTLASLLQLAIFFALPFVTINGHPAVLLDVFERKFILFGNLFWPQDMYLFGLAFLTFMAFLLFITTTFGRLWCGWLCPQTLFLEMVFRKIEYYLEGDGPRRRQLDQEPHRPGKISRKAAKHAVFAALSFVITCCAASYIVGTHKVLTVVAAPAQHALGFVLLAAACCLFYGVYGWFREQMCLVVCPYGRLQSVLQDANTITVSYDFKRGEPRGGNLKKYQAKQLGDCVDCKQCVHACPTGIDIRNGIQLECVNCTACIDACNHVMKLANRAPGLVRYASDNMIQQRTGWRMSPRSIGYCIVFLSLLAISSWQFYKRPQAHAIVTRIPGSLYQKVDAEHIGNIYSLQLINKTFQPQVYTLRLLGPANGRLQIRDAQIAVAGVALEKKTFLVVLPLADAHRRTPISIGIFAGERMIHKVATNFHGPQD